MIVAHHFDEQKERRKDTKPIRNYHEVRNEVHDKASGLKRTYKEVVTDGNLTEMIEARKAAIVTGDE